MYRLLTIMFALTTQVSLGQNENVVLTIEPRSADVGETVLIKIKTKVQGDLDIDNMPSCFVRGAQSMTGMQSEMDTYTGNLITYYYFSQTGAFGKEGKYTIGPVYIKKGNKTYASNTVVINIGDKTKMISGDVTAQQLRDPAFGTIQINKSTIYEGEPILVSAKVYAQFNPSYLDKYLPYTLKGAIDKYPIGNTSNPKTKPEKFKGLDFYAFEYDKNIIFPIGTGDFRITPYSMRLYQGYQTFSLTSSSATITVKPLPGNPPADFIGAVGHFSIRRSIEEIELKQGDVFKLKITISGTGNLQNVLEPTPVLPKGFVIYGDPIIEDNYSYTSEGAEGTITYEYNIQVSKYGELSLPASTISYFNTESEKYVTISTDESILKVEKNKNFIVKEMDDPVAEHLEELNILDDLRQSKKIANAHALFGTPVFWIGVSTPLLAAFLFLFISRRREKTEDEIAVRQTIRRKDNELSENLAHLNVLMITDDANAFYAKLESTLKKAFEIQMKLADDRQIQKQDIFVHLENTGQSALLQKVKALFEKCDQYRFGFSADNTSKEVMLDELKAVLNELRS